jgi:predicted nuclease of predicted toxin-antitoxin system
MWLLDANMPVQLVGLLRELGIEAESAVARGWNTLSNGSLVIAAARAKFTVLLTRDRLFGESAAGALKTNSEFCVVRVVLPQLRADAFLQEFRSAWNEARIVPVPGRMIEWPVPVL